MREFTRLMLSAYPKLPRVIEGVDRAINESATRSFYEQSGAFGLAERLARKIQIRAALSNLLSDMEGAMKNLNADERAILTGRFFGTCRAHAQGKYPFSKTTYYRRLKRGIHKVERFLIQQESEGRYLSANLNEITFFRYLSEHIKENRRKKEELGSQAEGGRESKV